MLEAVGINLHLRLSQYWFSEIMLQIIVIHSMLAGWENMLQSKVVQV